MLVSSHSESFCLNRIAPWGYSYPPVLDIHLVAQLILLGNHAFGDIQHSTPNMLQSYFHLFSFSFNYSTQIFAVLQYILLYICRYEKHCTVTSNLLCTNTLWFCQVTEAKRGKVIENQKEAFARQGPQAARLTPKKYSTGETNEVQTDPNEIRWNSSI